MGSIPAFMASNWLATKLTACGYQPEIILEDWGRCIVCEREPAMLWIGCANISDYDEPTVAHQPKKDEIVWRCFVEAEVPLLKRLFKKVDLEPMCSALCAHLEVILKSDPRIHLRDAT
jgi:hypothetical protein